MIYSSSSATATNNSITNKQKAAVAAGAYSSSSLIAPFSASKPNGPVAASLPTLVVGANKQTGQGRLEPACSIQPV